MTVVEMLKNFVALGACTILFGFMPGVIIGAVYHEYIYDDNFED